MIEAPPDSEAATDALLQEHDELVQLFIHDDVLAWQLNLVLLAANTGLLTAVHTLGLFDLQQPVGAPLLIVLLVGVMLNVVGFFVLQRRQIYRLSRLYRAYRVEDELSRAGSPIQTFLSAEGNIMAGRMLEWPDAGSKPPAPQLTRALRFRERVRVLDFRFAFNAIAIGFLVLALWAVIGRPIP